MLSGNGRHRRPRQAPALLVAAGVTGSAIAIPLLGAASASAADGTVWDKVAECESGGSWSAADASAGRYGGLQLTQDDWEKYGGLDYASSPDLASRSQQIAVAQDLLADRGTSPWGTCAVVNGLTKDSGALDLDTGVEEDSPSEVSGSSGLLDSLGSSNSSSSSNSSDSSNSSESSGSSNSSGASNRTDDPSGAPSKSSDGSSESSRDSSSSPSSSSSSPKADDSAKSETSPDAKASQSPDTSPVEAIGGDNQDDVVQDVGSWSLVDTGAIDAETSGSGRHRGPSADESETGGDAAESAKSSGRHASYSVRAGDTLASIADSLDLDGGWRALYAANKDAIGPDANHIFAGQTLDVPGK
ncbi:LysM peptidoglycan-binding domain-containing protein [Streptomyces caeruleatus]|uniref:Peptigoglycan-binding protein LysM n=1 Tax=Streptomyces caeruleatus TaxID=661399 RepID=A0A101TTN3_9ACTN|nr:transglycosylase family protein [Streptomyces caeruleatus]KUN98269.1 peptigoglycan-binding protein LysM [Streptomyces caeruleatus]